MMQMEFIVAILLALKFLVSRNYQCAAGIIKHTSRSIKNRYLHGSSISFQNRYMVSRLTSSTTSLPSSSRNLEEKLLLFNTINTHIESEPISDGLLPSSTVYVPPEVGWEIWAGSIVAIIPIIWATIEFTGRIRTQQQCLVCSGSGLVSKTKSGNPLSRPRKCWNCGGFLPWLGWKRFFFTSLFDVGNGGVLQRPAKDYSETNEQIRSQQEKDDKMLRDEKEPREKL